MCQMCEYKRDVKVMSTVLELLDTVDFDNFFYMSQLSESMIYTIDHNKDLDIDMLNLLEVPEDVDNKAIEALRGFTEIARLLQVAFLHNSFVGSVTAEELKATLAGLAVAEDDELGSPPSAFSEFFKGDDHDE